MYVKSLVDSIQFKLGQYVFTEMFTLDNIVEELNDCITDLSLYDTVWDWAFSKFDNTKGTIFIPGTIAKAVSYDLPRQIWSHIACYAIKNNEKIPMTYKQYGEFSNWATGTEAQEFYYSGNTLYLSEAQDVIFEFTGSPTQYTSSDYSANTKMSIPDDFKGYLKDRALANLMPIYLSDGQVLADKYYEKSENRAIRLAAKYGKKYGNTSVTAAQPGRTVQKQGIRRSVFTEEQQF